MYKQTKNLDNSKNTNQIQRVVDNAFIPFDPDNTDYQAFLKYQAEGGVVLPADDNEQTA